MAMDFPASPTNGQTYTSGNVTYTWNGYAWVAGMQAFVDAPSDDGEYVRVNGVWRLAKQTLLPAAGTSAITVSVPAHAKAVEYDFHIVGSGSFNVQLQAATVGSNFHVTSGDYGVGGPYHQLTGAGAYATLPYGAGTAAVLTSGCDAPDIPSVGKGLLNVEKSGGYFIAKTLANTYYSSYSHTTTWYMALVALGKPETRLTALRWQVPTTFMAGSQIHLRWL
jgi:hypothetical protein